MKAVWSISGRNWNPQKLTRYHSNMAVRIGAIFAINNMQNTETKPLSSEDASIATS